MAGTRVTQLSHKADGGGWHLYVVLLNTTDPWPEYRWVPGSPVPTLAQRAAALADLGYEIAPGAEWEWIEDTAVPDDPASPVLLIAAAEVRESGSGGAG